MGRRKKTDYPERLVRLIAACNGLPAGEIQYGPMEEYCTGDFPHSVIDFICWDDYNVPYDRTDKKVRVSRSQSRVPILWCDIARLDDDRLMLRQLVRAFEDYQETPSSDVSFMTVGQLQITFNPDSTLRLSSSRALELVVHEKIPIERLRICTVCRDLYLSKRATTPYCSKRKCSVKHHNRQRSENREYEQLFYLRETWRRLRRELEEYPGTSNWHRKEREKIELEIADVTNRGLEIRQRIEDRKNRRAI